MTPSRLKRLGLFFEAMRQTTVLGRRVPATVYEACLELFHGNIVSMTRWLTSPVKVLDGARPIDVAQTTEGEAEVLYLVGRLRRNILP